MGKTLNEVLEGTTHRQWLVWREWLRRQWNDPSRTDYYLMQLALILAASKKNQRRQPSDYKINFKTRLGRRKRRSSDADDAPTQEIMVAMVGGAARSTITRAEAARLEGLSVGEAAAERRRLAKERADVHGA